MDIISTLLVIIVVLIVFCAILIKGLFVSRRKNKKLKLDLYRQRLNIKLLLEHSKDLEKIQKDKDSLLVRISHAENDEDVNSVISDIIGRNNSRVQNNTRAGNNPTPEARKRSFRKSQKS